MYVFNSDTPDDADKFLLKSSKSPLASSLLAEVNGVRPPPAPVVSAQIATLAGVVAPSGLVLGDIGDAIASISLITNLGLPVSQAYITQAANEEVLNSKALIGSLEAYSQNVLNNLSELSSAPIAIANLSDLAIEQSSAPITSYADMSGPVFVPTGAPFDHAVIDVSTLQSYIAPVVITALSDSTVMVIDSANGNVQINDFVAPQAVVESFINTGAGTLTVTTAATHLASLSLSGNVAFTATADEVTSGITVSGEADAVNVALFLMGGASSAQGSSDYITLGNGNDFVLDAGDGQLFINLGSGQDTVILAGVGVTGVVNFAAHAASVGDMVAVAANGIESAQALSFNALMSIAGLNNDAQSQDAITFLSDMDSQIAWAGGTGASAHVGAVNGDAGNLVNWITAAQTLASNAHSVAWFQFGGNTYVLESANGSTGNHAGDTLIKLVGLTQFTGNNGEFSIGALHLAG